MALIPTCRAFRASQSRPRACRSLLLLITVASSIQGQGVPRASPATARLRETVDSLLPAELRAGGIPGASIIVVSRDSVLFQAGYGVASVETREPVTPETVFRIASTTKMLTAAATLAAQSAGLLRIDRPIGTWDGRLPRHLAGLTLHDLLRHSAGLRDASSYYGPHDESAAAAFVRAWSDTVVLAPPGDVYSYSNLGYVLAGHVLAAVSGGSYARSMERLLFGPLGMARTTLEPTQAMTFVLAQGHEADSLGRPAVVRPFSDDARFWPAGSVFTNATDFGRFARALLSDAILDGSRTLPSEVVGTLLQRQADVPDGAPAERSGYTYGLVERWRSGTRVLQHGGARIGFGSVVRLLPESGYGIVILTNRTGGLPLRTLEEVTTLLDPRAAALASGTPAGAAVSSRVPPAPLGRYVNHSPELDIELVDVGGDVSLRLSGSTRAVPLRRLADGRFSFGGQYLSILKGAKTGRDYLIIAGHALARTR